MNKEQTIDFAINQIRQMYGNYGAPYNAVMFAKRFYLKNNYYEYMNRVGVSDIEGCTLLILLSSSQVFLTTFDTILGMHKLECSEEAVPEQYSGITASIQGNMETFLHEMIKRSIDNARKLEEPKEWRPDVLPHINEMLREKYERTIENMKKAGHDCLRCKICRHRTECEIWQAIPKPFDFDVDAEDERVRREDEEIEKKKRKRGDS